MSDENSFTQELVLECPEGHRLAKLRGDVGRPSILGGRLGGSECEIQAGQVPHLVYVCQGCVRLGVRGATQPTHLRIAPLLTILAAIAVYDTHPHTAVRLTAHQIRARLNQLIPDGDPEREARRRRFHELLEHVRRDPLAGIDRVRARAIAEQGPK